MDIETRLRIEEGLRTWHRLHSEARMRFDAAKARMDASTFWQERARMVEASERLTHEDMAQRVY